MYVYIQTERWTDEKGVRRDVYTVGFYKPDGRFESDSDHDDRDAARAMVHYLNGGNVNGQQLEGRP